MVAWFILEGGHAAEQMETLHETIVILPNLGYRLRMEVDTFSHAMMPCLLFTLYGTEGRIDRELVDHRSYANVNS